MDKIEKLTPVIILITGTIINHVCKEKKELTISDFLIILSPSIPTVVPILVHFFTETITNIMIFCKTIEILKIFVMMADFFKRNSQEYITNINPTTHTAHMEPTQNSDNKKNIVIS